MQLCQRCEAPVSPKTLPAPGGKTVEFVPKLCDSCERDLKNGADAELRAMSKGTFKPLASLMPEPGGVVRAKCHACGEEFDTESTLFKGDKKTPDKTIHPTVCDECAAKEKKVAKEERSADARARAQWVKMTGVRYAEFKPEELPHGIRPHAERVMGWTVNPQGIGLVGPSRTGKSPLLYALGQKLYVSGVDVFPTSGIEFQRKYHRSFEHKEEWSAYLDACENADVLLIDDADKLNLTAGVESEYYGMLEKRRNWQLPVLCSLNLTGEEFVNLARERGDRASAIVERLRDLCEFIQVQP